VVLIFFGLVSHCPFHFYLLLPVFFPAHKTSLPPLQTRSEAGIFCLEFGYFPAMQLPTGWGACIIVYNAVGKNALAFRRVMNCWWRRCVLCLACALQERPSLLGAGRFTIIPKPSPAFRTLLIGLWRKE